MGLYDNLPYKETFTLKDSMLITERVVSIDTNNFKVPLYFSDQEIDFSQTQDDGSDLRITNEAEDTDIDFTVESWDKKNKRGTVWINRPKSIETKNTKFTAFWGTN